jgi:hypothetical protein
MTKIQSGGATVRGGLVTRLLEHADWRSEKAAEYPNDHRNQRSIDALRRLAAWVSKLPDDDPDLLVLAASQPYSQGYVPGDAANYLISRFGFHREEDEAGFREFLHWLVSEDLAQTVEEELDESISA